MSKDEIIAAIQQLSPEDREAVRCLLNLQAENDAGHQRLDDKLGQLEDRLKED